MKRKSQPSWTNYEVTHLIKIRSNSKRSDQICIDTEEAMLWCHTYKQTNKITLRMKLPKTEETAGRYRVFYVMRKLLMVAAIKQPL